MRVLQTKQITNPLQQQVFTLQTNDGILLSKGYTMDIELQGRSLTLCYTYYNRTTGGRVAYRGYSRSQYYGSGEYTKTATGGFTFAYMVFQYAIVRDCSYLYLSARSQDYEWSNHE